MVTVRTGRSPIGQPEKRPLPRELSGLPLQARAQLAADVSGAAVEGLQQIGQEIERQERRRTAAQLAQHEATLQVAFQQQADLSQVPDQEIRDRGIQDVLSERLSSYQQVVSQQLETEGLTQESREALGNRARRDTELLRGALLQQAQRRVREIDESAFRGSLETLASGPQSLEEAIDSAGRIRELLRDSPFHTADEAAVASSDLRDRAILNGALAGLARNPHETADLIDSGLLEGLVSGGVENRLVTTARNFIAESAASSYSHSNLVDLSRLDPEDFTAVELIGEEKRRTLLELNDNLDQRSDQLTRALGPTFVRRARENLTDALVSLAEQQQVYAHGEQVVQGTAPSGGPLHPQTVFGVRQYVATRWLPQLQHDMQERMDEAGDDPEARQRAVNRTASDILGLVDRLGYTPDPVAVWLKNLQGSSDVGAQALGFSIVGRIFDRNQLQIQTPSARLSTEREFFNHTAMESGIRGMATAFDRREIALASLFTNLNRLGVPPQQALQAAIARSTGAEADRLTSSYRDQQISVGNREALPGLVKTGFFGNPDVPEGMHQDFEDLTFAFFQLTNGDITASREAAALMLKTEWGITQIGRERRWMFQPPELLQGDTTGWVNEQLAEELEALEEETGQVYDLDRAVLTPLVDDDGRTVYQIMVFDDGFLPRVVRDAAGDTYIYIPEFESSPQGRELEARAQELNPTMQQLLNREQELLQRRDEIASQREALATDPMRTVPFDPDRTLERRIEETREQIQSMDLAEQRKRHERLARRRITSDERDQITALRNAAIEANQAAERGEFFPGTLRGRRLIRRADRLERQILERHMGDILREEMREDLERRSRLSAEEVDDRRLQNLRAFLQEQNERRRKIIEALEDVVRQFGPDSRRGQNAQRRIDQLTGER